MTRSRDEDPLDDSGGPSAAPGPPHPRVPMLSPSSPSFLSSSAFVLPTVIVILVYSLLGIPPLTSADANKTTAPPMSDQERALLR